MNSVQRYEYAKNNLFNTQEIEVSNFLFRSKRPLSENEFKQFLGNLPFQIFRIKGNVAFKDRTERLSFVGGNTLWFPTEKSRETSLIFVGWEMDRNSIVTRLKQSYLR